MKQQEMLTFEVGQCLYRYDDIGGRFPVFDITPAEVAIIRESFKSVVGDDPIFGLERTGTVKRTVDAEMARLRRKYIDNLVVQGKTEVPVCDVLFTGPFAKLPLTFFELEGREVPFCYKPGMKDNVPDYGDLVEESEIERPKKPEGYVEPVTVQSKVAEQPAKTFPKQPHTALTVGG